MGFAMTVEQQRATLIELLDHWRDFFDEPAQSTQVLTTDDEKTSEEWSLFSSMAFWPAVVELARCVEVARDRWPTHTGHLLAFTAYADWRLTDKPTKIRNAHGKLVWADPVPRVRERVTPAWVSERKAMLVIDGIRALVWRWPRGDCGSCRDASAALPCPDHTPLTLPPPLRSRLHEFTDQHGTHFTEAA